MSRFIAPALAILTLIGSAGLLSACNTTAGAGKDVSATGHAITNSADKVKADMP
jgi:predicted small secreted protein